MRRAFAIVVAGLAACSSPDELGGEVGLQGEAQASARVEAVASATGSKAAAFENNSEKDGASREFAYKWPAEVSMIPALAMRLEAERDTALAEQKAEWDAALAEFAGQDCVSCTARGYGKEWKVVADLDRYLSLSAETYLYTGGAHGNTAFDALVWDREANAGLDPEAMFVSPAAVEEALGEKWCKALRAERAKRMGADPVDEEIFPCPAVSELTLLLGSAGGKAFDRIGLIAAPYVAGSYAEGSYEATLPVTAEVIAAVKPAYRGAFAAAK